MPDNDEVVERLDRLITLFRIGFAPAIEDLKQQVMDDPVESAIIQRVSDQWVASGDLQRDVARTAKVSERTVLRSLQSLVERGLLQTQGSARSTTYRSTGIIG